MSENENGAEMDLENESGISEWDFGISKRNLERSFGVVLRSKVQNFGANIGVYRSELGAEFRSKRRSALKNIGNKSGMSE
jgi:hypothetical protein